MRQGNIEFKWGAINKAWELLEYYKDPSDKEYCIVIAFFEKDSEGYYMKTVGNRYFNVKDEKALNLVAKTAMYFLTEKFKEDQENEKSSSIN